jgi:signal transduction histidine kinase/CheY-like chemotaxis protein/HPt (histidine-containing phosphotransfer) domain-containing protein
MQQKPESPGKNEDQLKQVAEIIFKCLRDIACGSPYSSQDIYSLPESFNNVGKGLQYLNSIVVETRTFAKELSAGNLHCSLPSINNEMAAPLKSTYASLKHLTWQAQQVAKGDYEQRVSFMGDFSIAFNNMVEQLEQRHRADLEEKARLENMQHALEEANRVKSAFLAKMSHEIRTPINAIIGLAELALRDNVTLTTQQHIITIKQAGTNLLAMINDVLDFSRIESGKLEISSAEYSFSSIICDVVSVINMRVYESRLRFVVNIDSNIPNALFGDAVRIRQILLNLLSNAVKFTEKGFVSFSARGELKGDNIIDLIMVVEDSGRGVKTEDIGKLFDEFVQIESEKNRGAEGTGLGLAITRNLVDVMGGEISVTSEYSKGSKFTLTLPQKICKPDKVAYVENPQKKRVLIFERRQILCESIARTMDDLGVHYSIISTSEEFYEKLSSNEYAFVFVAADLFQDVKNVYSNFESNSKVVLVTKFGKTVPEQNVIILNTPVYSIPVADILNGVTNKFIIDTSNEYALRFVAPDAKVLIVDDINTNLIVAEGLMLPYEIKPDLCKSGEEAIQAVKSEHYDLVFMDHMMPGMDGVETTELIRKMGNDDPYYMNLPIVALTANVVSGMEEMFLEKGFSEYLPKPVDLERLNTLLEKWIPNEKKAKINIRVVKEPYDSEQIVIEGVDIKKGIVRTGGKIKKYLRSLSIFHEDGTQKIKEIKTCIKEENLPLYITHVHALKSASAIIGALELSQAAEKLEMAGKRMDLAFIETHGTQFLMDLETLLESIKIFISERSKKEQGSSADMELLKAELRELSTALGSLNSTKIKKSTTTLRDLTHRIEIDVDGKIENILKNVLTGEYDRAYELIESFFGESV